MSFMSITGNQSFSGLGGAGQIRPMGPPPGGPGGPGGPPPIDAVTDVLGMSADDIRSALQQGKSLSDLAESQGVSHEDLVSALKAGMPDDLKQLDGADQMVERIAAQTGVQGPDAVRGAVGPGEAQGGSGHHGYGSAARVSGLDGSVSGVLGNAMTDTQQTMVDALSDLLGTDAQSLVDSLRNGTSLADLVEDKGLDSSSLAGIIQNGLLVDTTS